MNALRGLQHRLWIADGRMRVLALRQLVETLAGRAEHDVAVDLGTARVRVFARGRGIVVDEPSVVRVRRDPLALLSVGTFADAPGASEPGFPVRPLREGVVRDVECAGWLLSAVLRRARGLSLVRPVAIACTPSDAQPGEIDALREAFQRAGAAQTTLVPETVAAAVGVGLDLSSPHAQMLVDVGEGVTDVVILRNGMVERTLAVRVGCRALRSAVADLITGLVGAPPSDAATEELVRAALAAPGEGESLPLDLEKGTLAVGNRAPTMDIEAAAVHAALEPIVESIVGAARAAWTRLGDESSCEVIENGVWLTGGGARLPMLVERIGRDLGIEVRIPENPLHAVVLGAGRMATAVPAH